MSTGGSRIAVLDGFRAVAILSVMLYHYFSRWVPPLNEVSLYPYGNKYNYFSLGYLGVQFFFMISGFVILLTLDHTNNIKTFWKKRLIRLLPSMVVASLLTFTVATLFDHSTLFPNSHRIQNLLPSLTFISPNLYNELHSTTFAFIGGGYWSLWPEIQFYLIASTVFYFNRERFLKNYFVAALPLICINYLLINVLTTNKLNIALPESFLRVYATWMVDVFNVFIYLPYFSVGILFYVLYKNKQLNVATPLFIKLCLGAFFLFILYTGKELEVRLIYAFMLFLFFAFIYYPHRLFVFEHKVLTSIGVASYFLYLIHENIGVIFINSLGQYFLPAGYVFTVALICALILFSKFFTERVDIKVNRSLKKLFISETASSKVTLPKVEQAQQHVEAEYV